MGGLQIVPESISSQAAPVFAVGPPAQKVEHLPEGECHDKVVGVVADQKEKGASFHPQDIQFLSCCCCTLLFFSLLLCRSAVLPHSVLPLWCL